MSHPTGLVVVLDANVLYPQWLRDLMLTVAALGYYRPRWSDLIVDEMRRNVLRDHPTIASGRFDAVTIAALRRAFPDAWTQVDDALVEQMDNAPEDRHVLAVAIAAAAHLVVTSNVDDFITSGLVESGRVTVERPSTFLSTVLDEHPEILDDALWHLASNRRGVATTADVLDRAQGLAVISSTMRWASSVTPSRIPDLRLLSHGKPTKYRPGTGETPASWIGSPRSSSTSSWIQEKSPRKPTHQITLKTPSASRSNCSS